MSRALLKMKDIIDKTGHLEEQNRERPDELHKAYIEKHGT